MNFRNPNLQEKSVTERFVTDSFSHAYCTKMAAKPEAIKNPEARLQASVARDIKIRLLDEHAKKQADDLAVAKWEVALATKDIVSVQKRKEISRMADTRLTNMTIKINRRKKLEDLFYADELKYERELSMMGLSFRRERL